jgi:hypothetical protein
MSEKQKISNEILSILVSSCVSFVKDKNHNKKKIYFSGGFSCILGKIPL